MYCKHYKGKTLIEKNIYQILELNKTGKDINFDEVIYSGDSEEFALLTNLVVYRNVFQNKIFAREQSDLIKKLSVEKKEEFKQEFVVEPLSEAEVNIIMSEKFVAEKLKFEEERQKNKVR